MQSPRVADARGSCHIACGVGKNDSSLPRWPMIDAVSACCTHEAITTEHVPSERNESSPRWPMIHAESACCTRTGQLPQNMWRRKERFVLTNMADDRCRVRVLHTHGVIAAIDVAFENKKAPPRRPMIDAESVCGTPTGQLPHNMWRRKETSPHQDGR